MGGKNLMLQDNNTRNNGVINKYPNRQSYNNSVDMAKSPVRQSLQMLENNKNDSMTVLER